jgi:hypothetical protein
MYKIQIINTQDTNKASSDLWGRNMDVKVCGKEWPEEV